MRWFFTTVANFRIKKGAPHRGTDREETNFCFIYWAFFVELTCFDNSLYTCLLKVHVECSHKYFLWCVDMLAVQ